MTYKLVWLENCSDDELTDEENTKTWKSAGFEIENDGNNLEVVALIIPNKDESITDQALRILEQYSKGLGDVTFTIFDSEKNIVATEEAWD